MKREQEYGRDYRGESREREENRGWGEESESRSRGWEGRWRSESEMREHYGDRPDRGWREEDRERGEFGSPHDQGAEHNSRAGSAREGRERSFGAGRPSYYGGSTSYEEPYRERSGREYDEGSHREREYSERPLHREERFSDYQEQGYGSPWRPGRAQQGFGQYEGEGEGESRTENRQGRQGRREEGTGEPYPEHGYGRGSSYDSRRQTHGEYGDYGRREPGRSQGRSGRGWDEENYGRGGFNDYSDAEQTAYEPPSYGSPYRSERPERGRERHPRYAAHGWGTYGHEQHDHPSRAGSGYESRERWNEQARREADSRFGRREDQERRDYEEWLREHRGRDSGSEGDRQLEGLREQHREHRSDRRRQEERQGREDGPAGQPRSQRRRAAPFQTRDRRQTKSKSRRAAAEKRSQIR